MAYRENKASLQPMPIRNIVRAGLAPVLAHSPEGITLHLWAYYTTKIYLKGGQGQR